MPNLPMSLEMATTTKATMHNLTNSIIKIMPLIHMLLKAKLI